jgi:hypothetical protein
MYRLVVGIMLLGGSVHGVRAQEFPSMVLSPVVVSAERTQVGFLTKLNADCTVDGFVTVKVLKAPRNGKIEAEDANGYPHYASGNQRHKCNDRQVLGTRLYYLSNIGFKGTDTAELETIYEGGFSRKFKLRINVK